MITIVDKLKNVFIDEEGKPKTVSLIILFVTIVITIFIISNLFNSSDIAEKSSGLLKINYELPDLPEEKKVSLDKSQDISFLKRDELSVILDRELPSIIGTENEKILNAINESQRDLILNIREERKKDMATLEEKILSRQDFFEKTIDKEIKDIKAVITALSGDDITQEKIDELFAYLDMSRTEGSQDDDSEKSRKSDIPSKTDDVSGSPSYTYPDYPYPDVYFPPNSYQNNYNQVAGNDYTGSRTAREVVKPTPRIIINGFTAGRSDLLVSNNFPLEDPGFSVVKGINAGTLIPAKLMVGLISSESRSPALVLVTEDVLYDNEVYIPKGSYFLGYGTADYGVRQIFVTLEKLVINDREINVNAHLVKSDGTPGFQSKYIDLTMEKFWPTFLLNFSMGILNSFKDTTYIVSDTGLPVQYYENTIKNQLIDGTITGATSWTDILMQDARKYNAIITVDPGIEAKVFLNEKIPLSKFK